MKEFVQRLFSFYNTKGRGLKIKIVRELMLIYFRFTHSNENLPLPGDRNMFEYFTLRCA